MPRMDRGFTPLAEQALALYVGTACTPALWA
jgi:hypothetical protein